MDPPQPRGGLLVEYGNRTAGVVNVRSRSGLDFASPHADVEMTGGSLGRSSAFASLGSRVGEKFAFYAEISGQVGERGFNPPPSTLTPFDTNHNGRPDILDPPDSQTNHDFRRTFQSFAPGPCNASRTRDRAYSHLLPTESP